MHQLRRLLVASVFVFSMSSGAAADIDVTGQWTLEYLEPHLLQYVRSTSTLSQSGTALTWGSESGTIDPMTGEFLVTGTANLGQWGTYQVNTQGTVDPDGNRMHGTLTKFDGVMFPIPYDQEFRAIRSGVSVCSDAIRDADEACDLGPINGQQECCDATCAVVDPDEDDICSELDQCPDDPNINGCDRPEPFTVAKSRLRFSRAVPDEVSIKFSAAITGNEIHLVDSIASLRLATGLFSDPSTDIVIDDFACTRRSDRRMDCVSADGVQTISLLSRRDGAKLLGYLKALPLSATGHRVLRLTDEFGLVRTATMEL